MGTRGPSAPGLAPALGAAGTVLGGERRSGTTGGSRSGWGGRTRGGQDQAVSTGPVPGVPPDFPIWCPSLCPEPGCVVRSLFSVPPLPCKAILLCRSSLGTFSPPPPGPGRGDTRSVIHASSSKLVLFALGTGVLFVILGSAARGIRKIWWRRLGRGGSPGPNSVFSAAPRAPGTGSGGGPCGASCGHPAPRGAPSTLPGVPSLPPGPEALPLA